MNEFQFKAEVWLYPGEAAWHFVSLPKNISKQIKKEFGDMARGWGSLPVNVKINNTKWKTSIFPESKSDTYILPLKLEVRKLEDIKSGDNINVSISLIM